MADEKDLYTVNENTGKTKNGLVIEYTGSNEQIKQSAGNQAAIKASKVMDEEAKNPLPKFTLSGGKVSVTGGENKLSHPVVTEMKKALSDAFKGKDLTDKDVAAAFQKAISKANEQIDAQFKYEDYEDFLKSSGFSDEAYRSYSTARQESKKTNPTNSTAMVTTYDKDGKPATKSIAEWFDYWKKEYSPEDRGQLWVKSLQASYNPTSDEDLYASIPAILMGSKKGQNVVQGFFQWINPFDNADGVESARTVTPVYGFDDTDPISVGIQSAVAEFGRILPQFLGAGKNPWLDRGAEDGGDYFGINDWKDEYLENWSREDFQEWAELAHEAAENEGANTYEKMKELYGDTNGRKMWMAYTLSLKGQEGVGGGKVLDTVKDGDEVVAEAGDYVGYQNYRNLWRELNSQTPAKSWDQNLQNSIEKFATYAPNAASVGVVAGQIGRIAAEQAALSLISGGALSASNIAKTLTQGGWKLVGKATGVIKAGQEIAKTSPALARAIYGLAYGSSQGLTGASRILYRLGQAGTWAVREVGEDALRGIVDDVVTRNSLDSQGNLDPNRFMENVYMNAVMGAILKGPRTVSDVAMYLLNADRNIDGLKLNGTQVSQMQDLAQAASGTADSVIKSIDEDGHPTITKGGVDQKLDQVTLTKENADKVLPEQAPTKTLEEAVFEDESLAKKTQGAPGEVSIADEEVKEVISGQDPEAAKNLIERKLTDDEIRRKFKNGKVSINGEDYIIDVKNANLDDIVSANGSTIKDINTGVARLVEAAKQGLRSYQEAVSGVRNHIDEFATNWKNAVEKFASDNNISVRDVIIALRDLRIDGKESYPGLKALWEENWAPFANSLLDAQDSLTKIRTKRQNYYQRDMFAGVFKPGESGSYTIDQGTIDDILGRDTTFDLTASSRKGNRQKVNDADLETDPEILAKEFVMSRLETIERYSDQGKIIATMREAISDGEELTQKEAAESLRASKKIGDDIRNSEEVKAIGETAIEETPADNIEKLPETFGKEDMVKLDEDIEAQKAKIKDLEAQVKGAEDNAVTERGAIEDETTDISWYNSTHPVEDGKIDDPSQRVIPKISEAGEDIRGANRPDGYGTPEYFNKSSDDYTEEDWKYSARESLKRYEELVAQRSELEKNGWKDDIGRNFTEREAIVDKDGNVVGYGASGAENLDLNITTEYNNYQNALSHLRGGGEPITAIIDAYNEEAKFSAFRSKDVAAPSKKAGYKFVEDNTPIEGIKNENGSLTRWLAGSSDESDFEKRIAQVPKEIRDIANNDSNFKRLVENYQEDVAYKRVGTDYPYSADRIDMSYANYLDAEKQASAPANKELNDEIKSQRAEVQPEPGAAEVDSANYRTGIVESDRPWTEPSNEGFYKFTAENINRPSRDIGDIGIEQTLVTPGGPIDTLNAAIRSGEVEVKNGKVDESALRNAIEEGYDESVFVKNFYDDPDASTEYDITDVAEQLGLKYTDEKSAEEAVKNFVIDEAVKKFYEGNTTAKNNIILYRVVSSDGNEVATQIIGGEKPKQGNIDWLKKESGDYVDDGVGFVTMDPDAVLGNERLAGSGDRYILRMHIAEGTPMFAFDNSVVTGGSDIMLGDTYRMSRGDRAGGEFALAPTKGKFVNSGEADANGNQIVDVYIGQEPPKATPTNTTTTEPGSSATNAKLNAELAAERQKLADLEQRKAAAEKIEKLPETFGKEDIAKLDEDIKAQEAKVKDLEAKAKEANSTDTKKAASDALRDAEAKRYSREEVYTPETERIKMDIAQKTGIDLDETPFKVLDDDNGEVIRMLDEKPGAVREGSLRDYNRDYKGQESKVILVAPDEYTRVLTRDSSSNTSAETARNIEFDESTNKYVRDMQNGDKFPVPYIKYNKSGFDGQEGRHRAMAAARAGYDKIPVAVSVPAGKTPEDVGFRNYDDITDDIAKIVTENNRVKSSEYEKTRGDIEAKQKANEAEKTRINNELATERQKLADLEERKAAIEKIERAGDPNTEAGQKAREKATVEVVADTTKDAAEKAQDNFNKAADKSNVAREISESSKYRNRASAQANQNPIGVNYMPGNPFRGFGRWINDDFMRSQSVQINVNGKVYSAYSGGYSLFKEAPSWARMAIIDIRNGATLETAIRNVLSQNGVKIEPTDYARQKYNAPTSMEKDAEKASRIAKKITESALYSKAVKDGIVVDTELLGSMLTKELRRQGAAEFTRFLKKSKFDSFSNPQQKWLNSQAYKMVASFDPKTYKGIKARIRKAMGIVMGAKYRSNMYGNFKNAQLQLTECQRLYTLNKLGDFNKTIRRLVTDQAFRDKIADAAYIYASDSLGQGLSKQDLSLFNQTLESFMKTADASTITAKGILTKLSEGAKKGTKAAIDGVDADLLSATQAAEYFKNYMLLAGIVQSAETKGLTGDAANAYIRNRFNIEALAGTEIGHIGLTESSIGRLAFMYMGFPIRELTLQAHIIKGGGITGGTTKLDKVAGGLLYAEKMLGAKGLVWALEAPWGYKFADVMGYDPFGVTEDRDRTADNENVDPWMRGADIAIQYMPFMRGAISSAFVDIYMAYRESYEDAKDEWLETHDSLEGFEWNLDDAPQDAIWQDALKGFTPGYTAFSRAAQEAGDLDRGYGITSTGNRMYETNTDPGSVAWGMLVGRSNTPNAMDYYQTANPIRDVQRYGLPGLGRSVERALPFRLNRSEGAQMGWRNFREFDPIDANSYSDWFDGSYADEQNWNTGYYAFREEAEEIRDAANAGLNQSNAVEKLASRESQLADLRNRVERYVQAYIAQHPEGISNYKMQQIQRIFNMEIPDAGTSFDRVLGDYSDYEKNYAENRVAQGNFPAPYGLNTPYRTQDGTVAGDYSYAQSPQLRNILQTNQYGVQSDVGRVIAQLDDQLVATPYGSMSLKDFRKKIQADINNEYAQSKVNYNKISDLQGQYLDVFDRSIRPIFSTYGSGILNAGQASDVMQQFTSMLNGLIPSEEYRVDKKGRKIRQSTPYMRVDIKKWLQKNYGNYPAVSTTDNSSEERLQGIRNDMDAGRTAVARAKALAFVEDLREGRTSIDRARLEELQNILRGTTGSGVTGGGNLNTGLTR